MFAGCNADQTPSDCAKVLCASLEADRAVGLRPIHTRGPGAACTPRAQLEPECKTDLDRGDSIVTSTTIVFADGPFLTTSGNKRRVVDLGGCATIPADRSEDRTLESRGVYRSRSQMVCLGLSALFSPALTHRIPAHLHTVSVVNQALENAIGQGRITYLFVPPRDRQLRG